MLIVYVFIGQAVGVCVVLFFLQRALNRMLVDSAIRQFDFWRAENNTTGQRLQFISHQKIAPEFMPRIQRGAVKFLAAGAAPEFILDRKLLGGMIVKAGDKIFDCSLRDRLNQVFGWN